MWKARYNDIQRGTWCTKCRFKSETCARELMVKYMCCEFPKLRPAWLDGLELDGYNEDMKLAFEYQGFQHYGPVKKWDEKGDDFLQRQERDKKKKRLCDEHDVKLIIIPYTYDFRSPAVMELFIRKELESIGMILIIRTVNTPSSKSRN